MTREELTKLKQRGVLLFSTRGILTPKFILILYSDTIKKSIYYEIGKAFNHAYLAVTKSTY